MNAKTILFILIILIVMCLPSMVMAQPEEETNKYLDFMNDDSATLTLSQKEMASLKSEITEVKQNVDDIKQEQELTGWKYWVSLILGIIIIVLQIVFKIKPTIPELTKTQSSDYQT